MNPSNGERIKTDTGINPADYHMRSMTLEDLDTVLEIENQSYAEPWNREHFLYELEESGISRLMVLEEKQRIMGYLGLWLLPPELHITNITVAPVSRSQGQGTRMMEYVMSLAYELRFKQVTLEVRHNNEAALALYNKFGFEVRGMRKNYYAAEKAHALIMSRRVR